MSGREKKRCKTFSVFPKLMKKIAKFHPRYRTRINAYFPKGRLRRSVRPGANITFYFYSMCVEQSQMQQSREEQNRKQKEKSQQTIKNNHILLLTLWQFLLLHPAS